MAKYGRKILRQNILTRRRRVVNWGQLFSDKLTPACEGGLLIKTRFSVTHNRLSFVKSFREGTPSHTTVLVHVRTSTYRVPVSWFVVRGSTTERIKKHLVRRKRLRSSENNHPKSGRIRCRVSLPEEESAHSYLLPARPFDSTLRV
jgi:hypothetical protein